jgi:two-component system, OmpR family, alkaline phosphatase synthesis response regulator PhoP
MTNNQKTKKVLVAEDDKFISRAYQAGLSKTDLEVIIAEDGEDAIQKIKSEKPDLILLDLIMPNKNGFDVLEEIRNNPDLTQAPVIILSNLGQEVDVTKAKELGAVDYFIKSNISMKEVIEKINTYLVK